MHVYDFAARVRRHQGLGRHPYVEQLLDVLVGKTSLTRSGFPFISDATFLGFVRRVPHLFLDGLAVLRWAEGVAPLVAEIEDEETRLSVERALKVLRTMVQTAAVTAPTDLWLLRHVLSEHRRLGILDDLSAGRIVDPDVYPRDRDPQAAGLDSRQLKIDLHFLHARGWVDYQAPCFMASPSSEVDAATARVEPLPGPWRIDWIERLQPVLAGRQTADGDIRAWLATGGHGSVGRVPRPRIAWIPTLEEIELGYRLVPLVLSLRTLNMTDGLRRGVDLREHVPGLFEEAETLLRRAGLLEPASGDGAGPTVTELGERVFQRGPGPFGIIYTYHPYLNRLDRLLRGAADTSWVRRAANVAASQDANAKTFRLANKALDTFCADTGWSFEVFVEHAVGKGEATRQRFAQDGDARIRYVGADLEDAAIDEAEREREKGLLPAGMRFIRQADIGRPGKVVDALRELGLPTERAVMIVGNGFHEIREQTNEKMTEALRGYAAAGMVLIFTEETGLTDRDLRATAWNTYHAGFRWVHETSGQGLRPSWDQELGRSLWSWRKCAEQAGYRVLDRYTRGTRRIFPIPRPNRENPAISVTYFCVPEPLARKLGLPDEPSDAG